MVKYLDIDYDIVTKSKNPKTIFEYSTRTEAIRLLFIAKKIATWQYQTHKFLILPSFSNNFPNNAVYFPRLNYTHIKGFWKEIEKVKETTPPIAPEKLIAKTQKLIKNSNQELATVSQIKNLQDKWQRIEKQVWADLKYFFPYRFRMLKKLIIYPTCYGTNTSYSLITPKSHTLHIYLRIDTLPGAIVTSIVSGLIRKPLQSKLHFTWEETTATIDMLSSISRLSKYYKSYKNYKPTLASTKSIQQASLTKQSQDYLSQLGFCYQSPWKIIHDNICFKNKTVKNLTKQEFKILKILIEHNAKTVSFDKLGNTLWINPDDYSLWGITKAIQRLRIKLEQNNIPSHTIQTDRKQGYSLALTTSNIYTNDKKF